MSGLDGATRSTTLTPWSAVSTLRKIRLAPLLFACSAAASHGALRAQASAKPLPTFEWVFSDSVRRAAALPSTAWLSDNTLMFYDTRLPAEQRRFEIIDPATGARRDAFSVRDALRSLDSLLPPGQARRSLAWPESFDAAGNHALYTFGGDLFVLDVPTSRFVRLTRTDSAEHSAEFSPDGTRVAFVRANDLYVVDIGTGAESRLTRDGTATTLNGTLSWLYWEEIFGRRDIGYWWSPDSKHIAYLQTDESKVDVMTFVDFAPLTPRVITQRYAKAGRPNPRARVGIVSVAGGATTWVRMTDKPFELLLRVKWLPDSRRVSVQTMTRDQREVGLYIADRASGAAQRIITETDPGYVNIHDDLHFLRGGGQFLWASERDGNYHIYRYALDSHVIPSGAASAATSRNRDLPERKAASLVNQVTRGPWSLASSGGVFWVRQAVTGIDGDWMYFTAMEKSSVERHLYRIRLDGTEMTRLSEEPGVHRITMAPGARFYTDAFSDARTLPSLALRRLHPRPGPTARQTLAAPRAELFAGVDIQYPEMTTIPARDGFPMPARILKPRDFRANEKHPVVMAVYGGASSATVTDAWQSDIVFYQLLLAEGYVVVKVDNRIATAKSKTLENLVVGRLGDTETADLTDAARWLKRQPWVDSSRVGVWGWSNGGYITLQLMTRSTEFKAGIAVAPVTDWRFYDSKWAEAFLGMPDENPRAYDSASVVTRAANLHGHLLVVHGTYDDNVQPQNTQAFFDALIKAGKPFEMMMYPMRKHDIGDRDANVHLYRTMLEFWKRSL